MKYRFIHNIDNAYSELCDTLKNQLEELPDNRRADRFFDRVEREFRLISNPVFSSIGNLRTKNGPAMHKAIAIFSLLKEQELQWCKTRIKPNQSISPIELQEVCEQLHEGKLLNSFKGRSLQPQNLVNYYLNSLRRFYIEADRVIHLTQAQVLINKHELKSWNSPSILPALAIFLEARNGLQKPIVNSTLDESIKAYSNYQVFSERELEGIYFCINSEQRRKQLNFKIPEENRERKAIYGEMLEALKENGIENGDRHIHRLSQGKTIHCCKIKGNTCMRCPYNVGFEYDKSRYGQKAGRSESLSVVT